MSFFIIVDGYNSGKQFAKVLKQRGYERGIHVQSTEETIKALSKFEEADYVQHFIYRNNIEKLVEEIKQFVGNEEILCVIAGSEPGVELSDSLSEKLNLATSNGSQLSSARRNKYEMRRALEKAGLCVPPFMRSDDLNEIQNWVTKHAKFPVVLKPLNSAGTDGVFICKSPHEVERAFYLVHGKSNILGQVNSMVLVEGFLEGTEYVVNSVSCQGKHMVNDIWVYRKKNVEGRNIYDREELLDFDGEIQQQLVSYIDKVLDVLGIQFGPTHAEVMMTKEGPVLVEVAARVSGATNIPVSQECVGHDAINLTLDSYLDPKNFFAHLAKPNKVLSYSMVIDLASEQEGYVEKENYTSQLSTLPSMRTLNVKIKPGQFLPKTLDLLSSPVKIHLVHPSKEQLYKDYEIIQTVNKTGFVLTAKANEDNKLAELWQKEYEKSGIPSSYRGKPSGPVSEFFFPYFQRKHPEKTKQNLSVVDMGTGKGRNGIFFAEKGYAVTAIDIVPENISQLQKYAEENNLKLIAITGDITARIPVEDKSVDIVIDIFCYKHQTDDKTRESYRRELHRILKDEGYYVLALAGKKDGYYGPLMFDKSSQIIDPNTNIGSVLFDPIDIKKEFEGYRIKKLETTRKEGLMHGKVYDRETHAFIIQKDLPQNISDSDDDERIDEASTLQFA